jgi:hypothetical protein
MFAPGTASEGEARHAGAGAALPAWQERVASRFAQVGPVLLIRTLARAERGPGRRCCAIDSFGVRESICFGDCRVYRLADSDYYAWDRLVERCDEGDLESIAATARGLRRADVVRSDAQRWTPVLQLSALGWRQVQEISRLEGAPLRHADPRVPLAMI